MFLCVFVLLVRLLIGVQKFVVDFPQPLVMNFLSAFLVITAICSSLHRILCTQFSLPTEEFNALQDLYVSTKGNNWNWQPNTTLCGIEWDFNDTRYGNPCSTIFPWQGVTCSSACGESPCNVQTLILSDYGLNGK